MKNRITDRDKKNLSDEAYNISEGSVIEKRLTRDEGFKVLAVENNKDNGMQAIAVASVDTKEIEILKLNNQIKGV